MQEKVKKLEKQKDDLEFNLKKKNDQYKSNEGKLKHYITWLKLKQGWNDFSLDWDRSDQPVKEEFGQWMKDIKKQYTNMSIGFSKKYTPLWLSVGLPKIWTSTKVVIKRDFLWAKSREAVSQAVLSWKKSDSPSKIYMLPRLKKPPRYRMFKSPDTKS